MDIAFYPESHQKWEVESNELFKVVTKFKAVSWIYS